MHTHLKLTVAGLLATLVPVAGAAVVVSPSADATLPGDAQTPSPFNRFGSGGSRNQVEYPAADFAALVGPQSITDVKFRPLPGSSGSIFSAGTFSISNVLITLSTTAKTESGVNALSATYADNVGADVKTVYSGPLTLTTSFTDAPGGLTKVFDFDVPLQSAFTYNPSAGNLLLDVTIPTGASVTGSGLGPAGFDDANDLRDGLASVVNLNTSSSATGTLSTDAPIAQFTYTAVPEPTTLAAMALAAPALIGRRRRRA